ncbi:hypothetical protein BHM03_00055322 [Ensete ventricosum]|nr:hypothetical protein BHM03_00055322 [Ensete ventricosum]
MDDCPERGDGVPRKRSEGRAHQRSVSHGQRELLEGIIVEDIRQATCVNHDPLHQCIADTDRDHQRIIMVGEFSLSCLEGDLGLVSFAGAFIRNGLCWSSVEAREVLDKIAPVGQAASSWFPKATLMTSRRGAFCGPRACPPPMPRWPYIGWRAGASLGRSSEVTQSGPEKPGWPQAH